MSTRIMSFIVPPAASIRCLILVNVSRAWLYIEPSPRTPPVPLLAVMPATKTRLTETPQLDPVPGGGFFRSGLLTRCIFMGCLRRCGALRGRSVVHRLAIDQPEPAAQDPIDEPDAHEGQGQPRDQQTDAERGHHEHRAEHHPQQAEPESADLPAE